jgi:subtilase family serine protease
MLRKITWLLGLFVIVLLFAVSPILATSSAYSANQVTLSGDSFVASPTIIPTGVQASSPTCSTSGLCPSMLTEAYGFNTLQSAGVNGTGQTVVIVDACGDPTISSDLQTFDSQFGLSNPTLKVTYVQGKDDCTAKDDPAGWSYETSLDVEWAHVVAPGAAIDLLIGGKPSSADLFGAWDYAIAQDLGNEISNSWSGSSACHGSVASIVSTASKLGITVLAATGDFGAWGQGTSHTEQSPADCKEVLAVGGTTLHVNASGYYESESGWGMGGGGYTNKTEPSYQVSANITDPYNSLAKPDVSADANPATGVWIYNSGEGDWGIVGGTSVACPLWAGFMADVNQIRASYGFHSGAGFVQPFLYTTIYGVNGGSNLYGKNFNDVTTGNNGWPAGTGWDPVTGLGSFKAATLAKTLGSNSLA